jgi:hypothetical protein
MNERATQITETLDANQIEWRSYSGRGMMGSYCVAVSCGTRSDGGGHTEGEVIRAVADTPGGLNYSRDSLGLGTILYWPSAKLGDGEDGTEAM